MQTTYHQVALHLVHVMDRLLLQMFADTLDEHPRATEQRLLESERSRLKELAGLLASHFGVPVKDKVLIGRIHGQVAEYATTHAIDLTVFGAQPPAPTLESDRQTADRLQQAIAEFIVQVNRKGMSQANARRLPELLRVAWYYEAAAEQSLQAAAAARQAQSTQTNAGDAFRQRTVALLAAIDPARGPSSSNAIETAIGAFESAYQSLKAELLEAGAQDRLPVAPMEASLQAASAVRRALQQSAKAWRRLADQPGAKDRVASKC